jgi:hypothetical protein
MSWCRVQAELYYDSIGEIGFTSGSSAVVFTSLVERDFQVIGIEITKCSLQDYAGSPRSPKYFMNRPLMNKIQVFASANNCKDGGHTGVKSGESTGWRQIWTWRGRQTFCMFTSVVNVSG